MADEVAYASGGGDSNKRKYEDSPPPVVRRATGFSSPPDSAAPPPLYNTVPPPMNEIELAKQKAQEIAARLLNNSDPSKRARVENGAGGGGGFDVMDGGAGYGQKPLGLGLSGPPQGASYGYPSPTKRIEIPNGRVGVIIGKGGETIKYLQLQSGAKIQVTRDMDADPNSTTRGVELMGTPDQVAKAEQLISDVLSEADTGGSGLVSRRLTGQQSGAEQFVMKVPNNKVGLVIGKGGETIKNMQVTTGARIQVIPLHLPPGDMSRERTVQIEGTSEQIEAARQLVNEVTSENRMRNSSMSGGYPQQGYQARPPTNWAQPGPPIQQPGYGYVQPGAYPGPSPQYSQQSYPGYPPQSTSGGYATGWGQSSAPQTQQPSQGGNYDYYNQQQPPQQQQPQGGSGAPTDASSYNYSQAPAYSQGQGYGQDGYSGYQGQGYGQPQPNPNTGYDQQQQGYSSAYANVSNPPPDAHTPSYGTTQGDPNQATAPSPNPNYPTQASTQPSYGVPPSSQAYAQPQQSPSAQGGGYAQPGYPGYAQTDLSAQRPPSSGYPTSQPGYGAPPYGVLPASHLRYGQQEPPAYNTAYGVGYSQPPAYSSDATPPPQSVQPSGAAKASPSS
ncbi:hypothetical protein BUALT_Bualt10G0122800 [Buddleja alternifolia]|uniref:K Homology domain-containing protein n=1 Tax=Buddleja alternifolia TaxID=168488 RepID=A0AAV6WZV7_9LAMI|nr:hypothetical protein BUALT_Bualt10G0122800 [Buddleja alternifolia]